MDKNVGKLLLCSLLIVFFTSLQGIELRITNAQGEEIEQAAVGKPFLLEVHQTAEQLAHIPKIKGLDPFYVKRIGAKARYDDNSAKHIYYIRTDSPGNFVVGPATISTDQGTITSKPIMCRVGDEEVLCKKQKLGKTESKEQQKAFLRLTVNKDTVVVGERVHCTLRFFVSSSDIFPENLELSNIEHCVRKSVKEMEPGKVRIKNTTYRYLEWQWDVFPEKEGTIVLPAHGVDYLQQVTKKKKYGSFGFVTSVYPERKRVYSNSHTLYVDPIPPSDDDILGVGQIERIQAEIEPAVAKQGEAMVLSIEVEGDVDFESVHLGNLINMPEQLKYYESKQMIRQSRDYPGMMVKRFEFIVQGRAVGNWEIPEQHFTYFDTQQRTYKTKSTNPLFVTITSAPHVQQYNQPDEPETLIDNEEQAKLPIIILESPWYPVRHRSPIGFVLFLCMVFAPLLLMILRAGYSYIFNARGKHDAYAIAFNIARNELKKSIKQNDSTKLYAIFLQLVQTRIGNNVSDSRTQVFDLVPTYLKEQDVPAWDQFMLEISQRAFVEKKYTYLEDKNVLKSALKWVEKLEGVL